jgi:hypothetical protein
MNEPQSNSNQSESAGRKWALISLGLIAGMATTIFIANRDRPEIVAPGASTADDTALLELTRTALAATENLATEEAETAWQSVYQRSPEDESVLLNRALNRVLHVDQLSQQAMDGSSEAPKRKAARVQLPAAIDAARSGIDDYEETSGDSVVSLWLRSRIDLHQADLLPGSMTGPLQVEVFQSLVRGIMGEAGKTDQSIILAGPLTDVMAALEDPSEGLPSDLRESAVEAVAMLSQQNPDNLFLAIQAARLGIANQSPAAKEWVMRTRTLAKAIEPTLNQTLQPIGSSAEKIVAKITAAIEAGNWQEAEQSMQFWFNVLNPTEIVKTDRRRASPHPLDKISFGALRRLSAIAVEASPIDKGTTEIRFARSTIDQATESVVVTPVDFDLDLDDDVATLSAAGQLQLWDNDGNGNWTAAADLSLGDAKLKGMVVVDLFMVDESHPGRLKTETDSATYRHNAFPSAVAFGQAGIRIVSMDGRAGTAAADRLAVLEATGLEKLRDVTDLTAGDLEGDGDLDLVVATEDGIRLFANRGNRTFFEVQFDAPFDGSDPIGAMAIVDLDRDLDLDVVTVHPASGRVGLLENLLHLQFRHRMLNGIPAVADASFIAVADIDANVSWDLIVGGSGQTALVFSQTAEAGTWTVERAETDDGGGESGAVADFDNDSWSDLLSSLDKTSIARLGPWGFDTAVTVDESPVTMIHSANLNSDGKLDAIGLRDGIPVTLTNETESSGHFLSVRFRGIADNAANSGRVNHFGIGSVLELRFGPHYRSHVITSPASHFGLGQYDHASSVRVILPNGLTQTIRDPSVDSVVEEEQKLKGSCPYLYAWDGEKFVFMTDCLWAAPLGLQVARGVVAKDRPWEYLKVDGRQVNPRDGRYEFRITEELWEVAYVDKLAMSAVDHPADVQIWTNEKVGPGDIATPTVFAFRDRELRPLVKALDTTGRDVTATMQTQDRDFVQGFDRRLRQGLCPPHWVDLDFGPLPPADPEDSKRSLYLVLTGWILPTDTSLNIQIDQNPELPAIEFPSVWVPDASSPEGWRKAIPFMGFPGGKTKTIVVDITDILVSEDPRVRIRTSAQIYWDSATLAVQNDVPQINVHPLELISAEVAYHGFSQRVAGGPRQPESYDYQQASLAALWPPLRGSLSQLGDCTRLVDEWDDAMVVISSGDEIRFELAVPDSQVPEGWQRDFVLHCVGWDKDADLNTLAGQTTTPLPFRSMSEYPPSAADAGAAAEVQEVNRNHLGREQSFRSFWYRGGQPEPSRFFPASVDGINRR